MTYIDNVDFAKRLQTLCGKVNAASLKRAGEIFDDLCGDIDYKLIGSIDSKNKPILAIRICGKISTLCQNCLEKMDIPIEYNHVVPIFYTESDMDIALCGKDAQYQDGILADTEFDIENFIEDELIMLLPMAPKHKECQDKKYQDNPDNPFKVLVNYNIKG